MHTLPIGSPEELSLLRIVPSGTEHTFYNEVTYNGGKYLVFNMYKLHQYFIDEGMYLEGENMKDLIVRVYGYETYIWFYETILKREIEELEA